MLELWYRTGDFIEYGLLRSILFGAISGVIAFCVIASVSHLSNGDTVYIISAAIALIGMMQACHYYCTVDETGRQQRESFELLSSRLASLNRQTESHLEKMLECISSLRSEVRSLRNAKTIRYDDSEY